MFALEMLCCGFTIASIILIESSDVKISLWFAAIPLAMTIAYSVILVINAKRYIHKIGNCETSLSATMTVSSCAIPASSKSE